MESLGDFCTCMMLGRHRFIVRWRKADLLERLCHPLSLAVGYISKDGTKASKAIRDDASCEPASICVEPLQYNGYTRLPLSLARLLYNYINATALALPILPRLYLRLISAVVHKF